ncbi:MAG: hypothetical protein VZR09_01145 [Candidatus Gastranaerophilaceae bacterium]|nr:hypothetical protein [Candidatus Gastranaerophilaceae bacterium]
MAIRVLMLLLSIFICTNIIIILVSFIFGENLYQKHGKAIMNGFGLLILLVVIGYVLASVFGLGK